MIFLSLLSIPSFGQFYSARVDLLGIATGNFNVEAAMTLNKKWTIHLPVVYNPFVYSNKKNTKFQNLTVMPSARYWFKQSYMDKFISMSLVASRFHIGNIWNDYRYNGKAFGAGLAFGSSYPLTPRWNFEWELGAAALWISADKFVAKAAGYKYADLHEWRIFPHKISASLIYLF